MRIVAGKIFRGAEYILGARYLEPPLVLKISHVDQEPREVRLILPHAAISHLGPGFELKRFSTRSLGVGRDIVIYKAVILNKWTVYGIIEKSWLQYIAARFICW
ncbi:MAG: hypothetical protein Q7S09_01090 [bacterium]|nr:hypothetical protein [bacterium]